MPEIRRDRRAFLSAAFFAFGSMCGILTARCASVAMAVSTAEKLGGFFHSSVLAASVLAAMAVPLLLLMLSMTLFGALLILPSVLLAGGVAGWSFCCLLRCGSDTMTLHPLLMLSALVPQVPCLLLISASCMRLSASLRMMVSHGGLRRPDLTAELRLLAVGFFAKLLAAILFAMLLQRWK